MGIDELNGEERYKKELENMETSDITVHKYEGGFKVLIVTWILEKKRHFWLKIGVFLIKKNYLGKWKKNGNNLNKHKKILKNRKKIDKILF